MGDPDGLERPLAGAPWINFRDHGSPELDRIAAEEGFHPLDVEDCRHRNQVAKVVPHEAYTFIVIKTIQFDEGAMGLEFDDFDLFLTPSSLTTVQETSLCTIVDRVSLRFR